MCFDTQGHIQIVTGCFPNRFRNWHHSCLLYVANAGVQVGGKVFVLEDWL
jgi:hypothetical protein